MSEATHTAGPWTYDPLTGAIWGNDADARDGYPVARLEACSRLLRAAQTNHANGRLIAAAPELLAALKETAECLASWSGYPSLRNEATSLVLDRAKATIAKAEGGGTISCECRDWCRDGHMVSLHHPRCSKYTPPPDDPRFAKFGKAVWKYITDQDGGFCGGECSEDILPLAQAAGLCRQVEYSPELHGTMEAEPGDLVWWWGDNLKAERREP